MKRRELLALAGACLWARPCGAAEGTRNAPEDKPRPDGAVLEAVLKGLLTDQDSPLEQRDTARTKILFSTEALDGAPLLEMDLMKHDVKQWKKLSATQLAQVETAAKEIVRRAAAKERFQGLRLKNPRVVLHTRADDEKLEGEKDPLKRLRRPQIFRAYPPGYSADGSLAVAHLGFTYGLHGGVATYVLAQRKRDWEVLMRQFIYYV
jgi:hypothetical protein